MQIKQCSKCGKKSSLQRFPKEGLGYRNQCKDCRNLQRRMKVKDISNLPQEKLCPKCGIVKPIKEYHKSRCRGIQSWCKKCVNINKRERDKSKSQEQRIVENKRRKERYATDKIFRDTLLLSSKKWQIENHEHVAAYARKYRKEKPEIRRRIEKKAYHKRSKQVSYRISDSISSQIYRNIKEGKGGNRWELLVGYNLTQLMNHLEGQFMPGMSWDNYGEWHIDHILPKAFFQFSSSNDVEFKKCWRLENLQPLWATENCRKGAKLSVA